MGVEMEQLDAVVRDRDGRETGVRLDRRALPVRVELEAERMCVNRPDASAMADDENGRIQVRAGDLRNGRHDSRRHLLVGLAAVPTLGSVHPATGIVREPLFDLLAGQAGPRSDVHLSKVAAPLDAQSTPSGHGLRGLRRSDEVARVDRRDLDALEAVGECCCLQPPAVGQRPVGMPLPAPLAVPVALAVAGEQDRRHDGYRTPPMDLGLSDRICVVTGSTAGIGLETARHLAADGAKVVVAGRDPARVEAARIDVGAALGIACDLAKPGEPGRLVAKAEEEFGRIDCLVNNVGLAVQVDFEDVTDDDWDSMWQLNVMSYVRAIRAAVPGMRERHFGRIVNVSSTAGKRPSTGMPNYTVTKAAVLSLSRLVADLYAKDGILCNAVCPGPTRSPAWLEDGGLADQVVARTGKTREQVLEDVGKGRPIGRMAEPEEIGAVVAFLCSDRASYVTGAAWSADGGTVPIII